jgi:transcriptional regulator with XRE-family HTH domain
MENAGLYSFRDVALRTGLGISTVSALMNGRRRSDEQTVQAVADALRLPVTTIRDWAARALGEEGPFELPPEFNQLNRRQREALLNVGRVMLDPGLIVQQTTGSGKTTNALTAIRGGADIDLDEGPDLSRVAARRGESEGRRLVEEQDRDAEHGEDDTHSL